MARDNSSLYVLSIVAVVAVVGLVSLFLNGEVAGDRYGGELVGQAVYDVDMNDRGPRLIDGVVKDQVYKPSTSREDSRARQLELAALRVRE